MIASDMRIATMILGGNLRAMRKKRQPIDDLIDALVWMRRIAIKKPSKRK